MLSSYVTVFWIMLPTFVAENPLNQLFSWYTGRAG